MAQKSPESNIPKTYDPKSVENRLYKFWEINGFFTPAVNANRVPFVIIMPPPNVTGQLHLGHALQATVEDAIIRHRRMKGFETLWLPGTDHAGIAMQLLVERALQADEGLTKEDLGREAFVERMWTWKAQKGGYVHRCALCCLQPVTH